MEGITADPWDALTKKDRRQLLLELFEDFVIDSKNEVEIEADLFHNHIPKLEDYGYIERNKETGVIERGENWDEIEPFLMMIDKHQHELPNDWI